MHRVECLPSVAVQVPEVSRVQRHPPLLPEATRTSTIKHVLRQHVLYVYIDLCLYMFIIMFIQNNYTFRL